MESQKKIVFEEYKENKKYFGRKKALYHVCWDLARPFRRVKDFAQKLFIYLPLLWNDRDWDHSYLLRLMEVKLSLMAEHFKEHDMHVGSQKYARQMRVASALCKRIREDDYASLPLKRLEEVYGELQFNSEPTDNPHANRLIVDRLKARVGTDAYDEVTEKERRIFDHARNQLKADKEYLFNLMKNKIDHWWC